MQSKNLVGRRIREARLNAHSTQMELAAQMQLLGIKIDRSGIAKIETGRRPVSDIEIVTIAKLLKVSIQWMFGDSPDLSIDIKN